MPAEKIFDFNSVFFSAKIKRKCWSKDLSYNTFSNGILKKTRVGQKMEVFCEVEY